MTHGFDLSDPLVCEGIVGDGCGGGRIFYIQNTTLFAFDPVSGSDTKLLDGLKDALHISKKACIITIEFKSQTIEFDLKKV